MSDLRFGVLGALEVWRGDKMVRVPPGRRRAVLACLLAHAGGPVAADALVEAGWGEDLPVNPSAALHTVVSRLRALLGDGVVRSGPAGYRLDVPEGAVDAREFEDLSAQVAGAPPREARRLLDRALGLWRGDAYAEFADREFAAVEAARLDQLRLDAVQAGAAVSLDCGEVEDARARLEALLTAEPFREHALGLLMTALYSAGRVNDALARYRDYRTRLAEELGLDPSPQLRDLQTRILGHDVRPPRIPLRPPGPPAWLDTSTAFVGRDADLADLVGAVSANRMVTVTGVGGVGKTRLVAQALPTLSERLAVPITVVELAPAGAGHVDGAVAGALGLRRPADSPRTSLVEYFGSSDGLLVLDNCEHVLAEVAALVRVVLRRCPRIRMLATSRHRLDVTAERVVPVEPLAVPAPRTSRRNVELTPAVQLFTDRARRIRPSFGVTDENHAAVADVCRRLDGLPLALELAASRTAVLGLQPVHDELRRTDALPGTPAIVEWSYRLLTADQQRLLMLLSVFDADFDLAALQGLAATVAAWDSGGAVAEPLAALVDASLLSTYDAEGGTRHRMLTIVRAFAADRLADSGQAIEARRAHAAWVRQLVEDAARDSVGPHSRDALIGLNRYRIDIDAALRWAMRAGDLPVAIAIAGAIELCPHWTPELETRDLIVGIGERCAQLSTPGSARAVAAAGCALAHRGDLDESRALARAALARATSPNEGFLARLSLGIAELYAGRQDESARWWQEIVAMADLPLAYRAEGHTSLALLACYHDDLPTAQTQSALARTAAQAAGCAAVHAFALYAAGETAVRIHMAEGVRLLQESATAADAAGAAHVSLVARLAWVAALVRMQRRDEALELLTPLLHDERRAGAWPQLWTTTRILAELLAGGDQPEDAVLLLAAADAADTAPPVTGSDVARYERLTETLRARLGAGLADRIGALAGSLPRAQVIDRALSVVETLAPSAPE